MVKANSQLGTNHQSINAVISVLPFYFPDVFFHVRCSRAIVWARILRSVPNTDAILIEPCHWAVCELAGSFDREVLTRHNG